MKTIKAVIAIVVTVISGASAVQAAEADFTPMVGQFSPTQLVADVGDGAATAEYSGALAFGGRLTVWANPNLGVEVTGMYTSTDLTGQAFGQTGAIGANLFYGTGRFVLSAGSSARLMLNAGLGFLSSSYDFIEGNTGMIGVVGAGVMVPVGHSTGIRFDVDDYIYNAQWDLGGGVLTDAITQHDVMFSAGITFRTGR